MNLYRWAVGFTGVLFVATVTGIWIGWEMFLLVWALIGMSLVLWGYLRFVWVRVPEMAIYVVFNRETEAFVRFLSHGRHFLWFPLEYVAAKLSAVPQSVQGKRTPAQTQGGVSVALDWSLTYKLEPDTADPEIQAVLARLLQNWPQNFLQKHAINCLQQIVGQYTVARLSGTGVFSMLETRLQQALADRLRPFGIRVLRVMVSDLAFPPQVTEALEAARERELYAESQARMLERLREALSQFSDEEMARLLGLQQLREMGQHGVSLVMPYGPLNTILNEERQARADGSVGNGRRAKDANLPSPSEGDGRARGEWPLSV